MRDRGPCWVDFLHYKYLERIPKQRYFFISQVGCSSYRSTRWSTTLVTFRKRTKKVHSPMLRDLTVIIHVDEYTSVPNGFNHEVIASGPLTKL